MKKLNKRLIIIISAVLLVLLCALFAYFYFKDDNVKGGPGTGMFEFPKAETITIEYKGEKFEVSGEKKQKIIDLVHKKVWSNTESKVDYRTNSDDIFIDFNTGRAELYINSENYMAYLDDTKQTIAEDIYTFIASEYDAKTLDD